MTENENLQAFIRSASPIDEAHLDKLKAFLEKKYSAPVSAEWKEAPEIASGFRIEIGNTVYDWTPEGRKEQLKESILRTIAAESDIVPLIRDTVTGWVPDTSGTETGTVISVGDGIANVSGLDNARYGEILIFESGIRGMIQDLQEDSIGCVLFGDDSDITEGSLVKRTEKAAGVPVGDAFIGRVVDSLGNPIDGKGAVTPEGYMPVESPAPGIIDRQPVNRPMETGLIAIDSMFPIGRGQRELIIGDRQTGKTAIALDTIINQRNKDVICIYVAIGQKASSVAQLVENLRRHGAMDYTIVMCASAADPAPLQYIAPYSGCAMGEYFMNKGRDVLIVYDDLSKHAIAYRALSLLLERSPGREAYPGDVFYLHSRLLERAAHLSEEKGGGSMTALPIVETQSGDVSAYIPTNIISITDGQIFLESDLFFAGQRPAVNVGLSVSRVGGDAQTKAVKKAAGAIRLELAQYREMEVFTQFSGDLDDMTKHQLQYGQGLMQLLKQKQYSPYNQHQQVILLVSALDHVMQDIPPKQIGSFSQELIKYVERNAPAAVSEIEHTGQLSEETRKAILSCAREYLSTVLKKG